MIHYHIKSIKNITNIHIPTQKFMHMKELSLKSKSNFGHGIEKWSITLLQPPPLPLQLCWALVLILFVLNSINVHVGGVSKFYHVVGFVGLAMTHEVCHMPMHLERLRSIPKYMTFSNASAHGYPIVE